jgi:transcriptional regulator with XRE-family HTH domain
MIEVVIVKTGELIKVARKNKKLTQKQLGELCEMSEAMIRQYELGLRKPKIDNLIKIADALNVSYDELMPIKSYFIDSETAFKNAIRKISQSEFDAMDKKTKEMVENLMQLSLLDYKSFADLYSVLDEEELLHTIGLARFLVSQRTNKEGEPE